MRLACVVVIATTGVARADGQLALVAGAGMRETWLTSNDAPGDDTLTPALAVTAGYRVAPTLALGVHLAGTRATGSSTVSSPSISFRHAWTTYSTDVAATAQLEEDRFTVAPWIGLHHSSLSGSDTECFTGCTTMPASASANALAFGVSASVIIDRRVPVVVLVDFQGSNEGALRDTTPKFRFHYSAITLGVGYRR